jgi:hypothetical protein
MTDNANTRQVGGSHYQKPIQHWDFVIANGIPYLEAQIMKYVFRWREKNGLQDLEKARHFLDKLIETAQPPDVVTLAKEPAPTKEDVVADLRQKATAAVNRLCELEGYEAARQVINHVSGQDRLQSVYPGDYSELLNKTLAAISASMARKTGSAPATAEDFAREPGPVTAWRCKECGQVFFVASADIAAQRCRIGDCEAKGY